MRGSRRPKTEGGYLCARRPGTWTPGRPPLSLQTQHARRRASRAARPPNLTAPVQVASPALRAPPLGTRRQRGNVPAPTRAPAPPAPLAHQARAARPAAHQDRTAPPTPSTSSAPAATIAVAPLATLQPRSPDESTADPAVRPNPPDLARRWRVNRARARSRHASIRSSVHPFTPPPPRHAEKMAKDCGSPDPQSAPARGEPKATPPTPATRHRLTSPRLDDLASLVFASPRRAFAPHRRSPPAERPVSCPLFALASDNLIA